MFYIDMSRKYKFGEKEGAYFVSFSVVYWIDLFTREDYFNCFLTTLEHCRKTKGMELYGCLNKQEKRTVT